MLKIFTSDQLRQADAYTISHEPVSSIDLMERAALKCADWINSSRQLAANYKIFCGNGNNGGDGLAIARMLYKYGKNVEVYVSGEENNYSPDFKVNYQRLSSLQHVTIHLISLEKDFPVINRQDKIIDALFGTGLNREVAGLFSRLIKHINEAEAEVFSIDMPSGLYSDKPVINHPVIKATHTLTFQFPKLSFFFPENALYTGKVYVLDIGIHKEFIQANPVKNFLLEVNDIIKLRKPRNDFSHKGNYGHALIISGSYGKMGAAVLCCKACIRSGAGLVTACIPGCGYAVMQTAAPEIMVITDESQNNLSHLPDISGYNSIGIGPGIATAAETGRMIKLLIQNCTSPAVFDADAINLLSENKTWLSFIPNGCIFTPHPGEFKRLVGNWSNCFERQQLQLEFSRKYSCYVVLKDHFTSISFPDGTCYFNPTGNPGMATAGSGDVLTGLLTGLLAQGYPPRDAVLFGVYLHGLAGDIAAKNLSMEAMTATDIIQNLGNAFNHLTVH